jgi:hypothetical protein
LSKERQSAGKEILLSFFRHTIKDGSFPFLNKAQKQKKQMRRSLLVGEIQSFLFKKVSVLFLKGKFPFFNKGRQQFYVALFL